jgi:hypothetical protein
VELTVTKGAKGAGNWESGKDLSLGRLPRAGGGRPAWRHEWDKPRLFNIPDSPLSASGGITVIALWTQSLKSGNSP